MELALPIVALGGLYIVSNQDNKEEKKKREMKKVQKDSFTNMGKPKNYIPNVDTAPVNYPITNTKELAQTTQQYANPNTSTDKYFNQTYFQDQQLSGKKVGNDIQQVYTMTGNYLDTKEFKHNNMVPFNGGQIRGNTYDMALSESILDNMVGSGTNVIKKVEQAPLFKPEDNISFTKELESLGSITYEKNMALVSIIGNNINHTPGVSLKIFEQLSNINITSYFLRSIY